MKKLLLFLALLGCCYTLFSQDVTFKKSIDTDSLRIDVVNQLMVDIEFFITPKDSLKNKVQTIKYAVIPPTDTLLGALRLPVSIIEDTASVVLTDYIEIRGTMGNPSSRHDQTLYELPFGRKRKHKIIQGFGGSFSHDSEQSRYAVDINTQVGDTIYAARSGLVIRTRDQFTERGGREMRDKANLVNILHNDGTIASYVHLDYQGVLVKAGQEVKAGDPIGISGFTGFTTTPHLHFVVREAGSKSVPFYFKGYTGGPLRKNMRLKKK